MPSSSTPATLETLAARTRDAAERSAELSDRLEERRGEPPQPGELWSLPEDAGVEWAVLEVAAEGIWVVPADTFPLVGSTDLWLPAEHPCGPLALRCGLARRLGAGSLAGARRSGLLDATTVERARFLARAARSQPAAAAEADAVDRDPAYRQHCEALADRLERLVLAGAPAADARRRSLLQIGAAAAAALLVALGWIAVDQGRRIAEPETGGDREAPTRREPLVNAPFLWLQPDEAVRGEGIEHPIPEAADSLLLILQVNDLRPFERYRIELFTEGGSEPLWTSSEAVRTGTTELSVDLPRELLQPRRYTVRLAGLADGEAVPLHSYSFRPLASP